MSSETVEFKAADGESLGAGASILPIWPMLRSAIAESISADALCPMTCGELTVGEVNFGEAPTPLMPPARSSCWAPTGGEPGVLSTRPGRQDRRQVYTAGRLQELVLEAMDSAFESILGEGLGLGPAVEISSPDAPMLLCGCR